MELEVQSVNISESKGTIKKPVDKIELNSKGVVGDAHSGMWHRQVSLLGSESIDKFTVEAKREIKYGEFAENITTKGYELYKMMPMDMLRNDSVELMITQIGKKCHGDNCEIFKEVGNCVMPKEGIFAKVIKSGALKVGDKLEYVKKIFKITIITLSDRASIGEYEDRSGPEISKILNEYFSETNREIKVNNIIIPDEEYKLAISVDDALDDEADIIITTGGTGIGPRDITPDVISGMLDKEIPGIMEHIRVKYGSKIPGALLSRGVAGVIDNALVFTLPGSVKAVREYMAEILPILNHALYTVNGLDLH